ncbi:MAG TPA: glycoside hydrolase family 127 protein [Aggregatilineales bacterium]|nr:glycoside hydrolase family 127 protein [Aggregatilineales bacterium]
MAFAPVVDTTRSPFAQLRPVAVDAVTLTDTFWSARRQLNREVIIPGQASLCESTGRVDNLRVASGRKDGQFEGWFFNDSDIYKLLEAAGWQFAGQPDPELDALVDSLVDEIAAAQQPDGYLNSYFMGEREKRRWTNFDYHEMYCAGHLIQAAVAHHRTTGKRNLLDVAIKFADHICARFGPEEQGKVFGTDGHPEIEMALAELYRVTGDQKYLDQVQYFIDARGYGRLGNPFGRFDKAYHQDHLPFRELNRLEGHSVRAVYLNCGATDLYSETGEPALRAALEHMWESMTTRQMYINGGLGSRHENEGFGTDYELPPGRAHTETCASVASFMWNWRMLMLEGDGRFADQMEVALYNSVLSGISLDGTAYYYQNPLLDDGAHRRQQWFPVACCPSNVSRTLASLPGYLYTVSENTVWAHHYASNSASVTLPDGRSIELAQQTQYPWDGKVSLTTQTAGQYDLKLRIPGWVREGWALTVNGQAITLTPVKGYVTLSREWHSGDQITLDLPMPVERIESHPLAVDNQGRVALMRGPVLYCLEAVDNPGVDVRLLLLPDDAPLTVSAAPDLAGGVSIVQGTAQVAAADLAWDQAALYRPRRPASESQSTTSAFKAIPYFAWANRDPGPMVVWLRTH